VREKKLPTLNIIGITLSIWHLSAAWRLCVESGRGYRGLGYSWPSELKSEAGSGLWRPRNRFRRPNGGYKRNFRGLSCRHGRYHRCRRLSATRGHASKNSEAGGSLRRPIFGFIRPNIGYEHETWETSRWPRRHSRRRRPSATHGSWSDNSEAGGGLRRQTIGLFRPLNSLVSRFRRLKGGRRGLASRSPRKTEAPKSRDSVQWPQSRHAYPDYMCNSVNTSISGRHEAGRWGEEVYVWSVCEGDVEWG
jgi:hypothetical protein